MKKNLNNKCLYCKNKLKRSEKYDSFYCQKCLYWTERICPDRNCEFCKNRPKYPKNSI